VEVVAAEDMRLFDLDDWQLRDERYLVKIGGSKMKNLALVKKEVDQTQNSLEEGLQLALVLALDSSSSRARPETYLAVEVRMQ